MDITINLATGGLVRSASNRQAVSNLRFKRGDSSVIRVFFVDGVSTTPVRLPVGTTGKFGLKEQGKYDDGFVVSDVSWTEVEEDGIYHYVFEPNFNTTQLNALLGIGEGDDKASVTLMGEIEWISSGSISSSATFSAIVQNDVIRGDEGVPTDGDPEYPNPENIVTFNPATNELTVPVAADFYAANEPAIANVTGLQAALDSLFDYYSAATSSAEDIELSKPAATTKQIMLLLTVGAGVGTYTTTVSLGVAGCVAGDVSKVILDMPASENPTIEIRNATSGGTLLYTLEGTGAAFRQTLNFIFNGTAWISEQ